MHAIICVPYVVNIRWERSDSGLRLKGCWEALCCVLEQYTLYLAYYWFNKKTSRHH